MASISQDITKAPPEVLAMLATMPSIPPPNGIVPNFLNPYTRAPTQVIPTSIILGLVVVFFCNRVYVKLWLQKRLSWDDGTLFFGMVSFYESGDGTKLTSSVGKRCLLRIVHLG